MIFLLALLPTLAALAVPAAVRLVPGSRRQSLLLVAMTGLALTLIVAVLASIGGWTGTIAWAGPLVLTGVTTPISGAMAILVPMIAMPVLAYAAFHEEEAELARLIGILLLFVAGMESLVVAGDLLTLLIGWELVGICSYLLIAHEWNDRANPASALYAFLMTRFGDLGLFAAAMATYAATGSFSYDGLPGVSGVPAVVIGFGLVLSAASKSGQVPFSPWLFRAMAGPTSVSALLHAATMVAAGAYIIIRLQPFLATVPGVSATLVAIGLFTALAGGLVALFQNHAKKLLAASTSAHFGLMFAAVGSGYPGIAFLHLIAHATFKAPLFLAAGIAGKRSGSYDLNAMRYGGVFPIVAGLTAVASFSLAGVPPFGGAFTKEAVVTAGEHNSLWAAAAVILAGGLSAAYAARFQLSTFGFGNRSATDGDEPKNPNYRPSPIETWAPGTLALMVLATSLLFVPSVRDSLSRAIGIDIVEAGLATFVVSTLAVLAGILVGTVLVRRAPKFGLTEQMQSVSDWLGLPQLIDRMVTRPVMGLARAAASIDDWVIDAAVQMISSGGQRAAWLMGRRDDRILDRGVSATAGFVGLLAFYSSRTGEWLLNGLADGTAMVVGQSGRDARRIQTGMSHHYYALAAAGAVAAIIFLLIVS